LRYKGFVGFYQILEEHTNSLYFSKY